MQTLDFAFYGTQQLLAEGLSDWSAGVGRMRREYGIRSFAYDSATVGSATWRRGVSNRFTAELHAEGGGGVASAGAIAGMSAFSAVMGLLSSRLSRRHSSGLLYASSAAALVIGGVWLVGQ